MWYGILDGEIWLETKIKSQKAVNLRRDPRFTFMIEDGDTYDTLRGVSFEGTVEIVDDPDTIFRVGISVWERYTGPYTDEMKPGVDMMMNKRVACAVAHRPHALVGSPQARHARNAGVGFDGAHGPVVLGDNIIRDRSASSVAITAPLETVHVLAHVHGEFEVGTRGMAAAEVGAEPMIRADRGGDQREIVLDRNHDQHP